jgi:hypothetical protein
VFFVFFFCCFHHCFPWRNALRINRIVRGCAGKILFLFIPARELSLISSRCAFVSLPVCWLFPLGLVAMVPLVGIYFCLFVRSIRLDSNGIKFPYCEINLCHNYKVKMVCCVPESCDRLSGFLECWKCEMSGELGEMAHNLCFSICFIYFFDANQVQKPEWINWNVKNVRLISLEFCMKSNNRKSEFILHIGTE